ncbi:hypothetical protein ACSVHC_01835 [Arthrobacter sp. KNU-44]|uniref:hypothetical protein n=1 Tax=Arthrobacter sp. KNU-44 TaxID=3450744 RepID=UPI003F43C66D
MTGFKPPAPRQVEEALRRIPTRPLRRAFFEGLKNPLWVEPLARAGMFDNPPEPEVTDDGLIQDFYWPEIDYLIRVAPASPQAVVDVLLKLADSNNAWVRRAVFTIGASIPADNAAALKPLLKKWETGGFGWRSDPRDMVSMVVNLLQGGQDKTGKWLANLLFRPSASENKHKAALALDEYWYDDGLPRVAKALGDDGLKTVLPWLEAYERHSGHLTDTFDMTEMSRESIRHRSDNYPSVEHSLIETVRDLATGSMASKPQTTKTILTKSPMTLARKILLYAVAETLLNSDEQTSTHVGDDLHTIAEELLSDNRLRDDSYRIELGELARAVGKRRPSALDPLIEFISAGPQKKLSELQERLRRDDEDTPEVLQARVQLVFDSWKHRWLSAIGGEVLPPTLQPVLAELDSRLGVIDAPLSPVPRLTTWSGPNGPISRDDMSVMSPAELTAHLASWHDTADGWGPGPSHEGQGRELSALVATNPRVLAGAPDLVDRLRPTYLRAILQGWEAALKAALQLEWLEVADLISGVLAHADASSFPIEGGEWDDDVDFRWAKNAAVSLLEELAKKRDNPLIPPQAASIFAGLLINKADDEVAWKEYDANQNESGMDPLNLSINRQWPIRLHGLINLMSHGQDAPWYEEARASFERELEKTDRHGASRAIVGENLGRLLTVDPDWLNARAVDLFGSTDGVSPNQQIALTTTLAVHYYHPALYDLLAPSLETAIRSAEPLASGWRGESTPQQRIGEWVVTAIIQGHKPMDDPLAEAFFTVTEPKVRGKAIGHIAWSFMHAESVDSEIRDRFADLWDARVKHVRSQPEDKNELNEFYWFVRSGKFDPAWWLPRLKEAVQLDPDLAGGRFMMGKQIASAADADPRQAFDATKILLSNRQEAGMPTWDLTQNAVPMVIARAIVSGDKQLKEEVILFMNELGEKGDQGLQKAVNDVLNGKITQDNVGE